MEGRARWSSVKGDVSGMEGQRRGVETLMGGELRHGDDSLPLRCARYLPPTPRLCEITMSGDSKQDNDEMGGRGIGAHTCASTAQ